MKPIFIRKASATDLLHVAANLTVADAKEVTAMTGLPPAVALQWAGTEGREVLVAGLADEPENPMLVYGCDPSGVDQVGSPWLLTTDAVANHPVEFAVQLKREWARFHETYPVLVNWTLAENHVHRRLLFWLGCKFVREAPLGPDSTPFVEFVSVNEKAFAVP